MPREDATNRLTLENTDTLRILQLTDFHSDVSEFDNERTRADVRAMVTLYRPHFLAVTGDIWCGDGNRDTAAMWMARDLDFLASLETPWAFTWGNHDFARDFSQAQDRIARTPHYAAPEMTERGECHIEVAGKDGNVAWDLFFANSMDEWQMPEDLAWLPKRSDDLAGLRRREVPALLFFHIPLRRYQIAIDEGRTQGLAMEEVLFWGDEADSGADLIISSGNIRACFCGHSHRNDCYFEEGGVTFAYGRSTGYGGYGSDVRKGAKRITLSMHGAEMDFETVFGDGTVWRA
jgi:hypothetical protein